MKGGAPMALLFLNQLGLHLAYGTHGLLCEGKR